MEPPSGAPEWLEAFTAAERPDLWERAEAEQPFRSLWPEYNHHGTYAGQYFGALVPRFAHLQALFVDRRSERLVARARTIPFRWDGTLDDLPAGIDALGVRALRDPEDATALSALAAEVDREFQGAGLSAVLVRSMAAMADSAGLGPLVAPVRPVWKDRYPITPIERYVSWRRNDGLPFDPWIRVHEGLGGTILRCEPKSLGITASVKDWEGWTKLEFPEDGEYVFPSGLAPLSIRGSFGHYFEPNVWIIHEVPSALAAV